MSVWEKGRYEIWNLSQHPYKHSLSEFAYSNPSMPGVTNIEGALNYILAVLYPNTQDSVANVAALPASGNTINDFRVVQDDGDGKAAGYRWEQREGEATPSWHKIYDMDWGQDSILQAFQNRTDDRYVHRRGYDDIDDTGAVVTGVLAGQQVYGGKSANSNLTLSANSGDGAGANTGYVQTTDHFRPTADNTLDLGVASYNFRTVRAGTSVVASTLTLAGGSITDSSGAISFANENLTTTGTFSAGTITGTSLVASSGGNTVTISPGSISDSTNAISFGVAALTTSGTVSAGSVVCGGALTLAAGSITDSSGTISFNDENLTTTGTVTAGRLNVDNLRLDANTLSSTNTDGNIVLTPNGTGVVSVSSSLTAPGLEITGTATVVGQLNADNIRIDGNVVSSTDTNGNITFTPNGTGEVITSAIFRPGTDAAYDLGKTASRFKDIFLSGSLKNGTTTVAFSALSGMRANLFRDFGQTSPAQTGDSLFYDAVNGVWLASAPDTEIDHGSLSGLSDDDHSQYALLAGRAGGQTLLGDTASSGNLVLESTANATKGFVLTKDHFAPNTTASYSGSWSGTDLGGSSRYFRDLYTKGQAYGFRLENVLSGGIPSASAQNVGRIIYVTDTKKLYVDTGSALQVMSISKFSSDVSFDGIVTTKDVTVSASVQDARLCIWALHDNANDYERVYTSIKATSASNVRITTNAPLPAGSYRLIGIE